jgi:uncharacterized protein (DUF433 family)
MLKRNARDRRRYSGHSFTDILKAYPYLEQEDLREALEYAAWRVEEIEIPLSI